MAFPFKAKHVREKDEADFQRELSAMNGWLPESTWPPAVHTSWALRSVPHNYETQLITTDYGPHRANGSV